MGIKWLTGPSKNATGIVCGWRFGHLGDGLIVVDLSAWSRCWWPQCSTNDENHFYAATSDALLSIDSAQYPAANSDVSAEAALMRWKEIAWLSSETKPTISRTTSARSYRKSPVQAIVTKRDQVP
jgi:hypothetical protein